MKIKWSRGKIAVVVLSVVLFLSSALAMPTTDAPKAPNNNSQISGQMTPGTDKEQTNETSKDKNTEKPSKEETDNSKGETDTDSKEESGTKPSDKPSGDTSSKPSADVGTGTANPVNVSNIPAYSGNAYIVINNNVPNFSATELKTTGYETYAKLDSLGRTQVALASVGKDTMPKADEERGSISSITPSGWKQAKYDSISGGWLYNRCHLIGWQLSAENANKQNLLTGTKYLNINGMLPFENMVADYIKETGNHVAYRITPIYQGNNLLASGVQMEAYSVEDKGEGICFNVYCYNVQPGITINYADGSSVSSSGSNTTQQETTTKPETPSTEDTQQETNSVIVYTTATGKKYHSTESCSGLNNAKAIYESTLENATNKGLEPCSKCH